MKYQMNNELIFTAKETKDSGIIEIQVNGKPLINVDLEEWGFDYTYSPLKKFKAICQLLCFDFFHGNELGYFDYCYESGLREIKEHY